MSVIERTHHRLENGRALIVRSAEVNDAWNLLESAHHVMANNDFAPSQPDGWAVSLEKQIELIEKHRWGAGKLWLVAERDGMIIGSLVLATGDCRRVAHRGTRDRTGLPLAWSRLGQRCDPVLSGLSREETSR